MNKLLFFLKDKGFYVFTIEIKNAYLTLLSDKGEIKLNEQDIVLKAEMALFIVADFLQYAVPIVILYFLIRVIIKKLRKKS